VAIDDIAGFPQPFLIRVSRVLLLIERFGVQLACAMRPDGVTARTVLSIASLKLFACEDRVT
jgi:hypothetical protein